MTAAEALRVGYQPGKGRLGAGWIDQLLGREPVVCAPHPAPTAAAPTQHFPQRQTHHTHHTDLGAITWASSSVQASLDQTIDDLLRWWGFDVMVIPARPYRARTR